MSFASSITSLPQSFHLPRITNPFRRDKVAPTAVDGVKIPASPLRDPYRGAVPRDSIRAEVPSKSGKGRLNQMRGKLQRTISSLRGSAKSAPDGFSHTAVAMPKIVEEPESDREPPPPYEESSSLHQSPLPLIKTVPGEAEELSLLLRSVRAHGESRKVPSPDDLYKFKVQLNEYGKSLRACLREQAEFNINEDLRGLEADGHGAQDAAQLKLLKELAPAVTTQASHAGAYANSCIAACKQAITAEENGQLALAETALEVAVRSSLGAMHAAEKCAAHVDRLIPAYPLFGPLKTLWTDFDNLQSDIAYRKMSKGSHTCSSLALAAVSVALTATHTGSKAIDLLL